MKGIDPTDKSSIEWLNSFSADVKGVYKSNWLMFLEFTGMTGDQILAYRQTDNEHRWERKVLQFKQWMLEQPKKRNPSEKQGINTARTATSIARSFFAFHYKPLMYRRQERKELKKSYRKTEDYLFSREDLKRMADVANLKEQYVVVAGKSFGLRASDFNNLSRGDLEPYINRDVPIHIGKINTIKENVPAYPFIDSDAQPVIKLMLEQMTREGRISTTEKMLTYEYSKELTQVLKRLAIRAGIVTGNKRVRFHCLRKFLIDNLSRFMSESKWKQIVGKVIDEKAYVSPDSLREDYKRAMAETTFAKTVTSEGDLRIKIALDSLRQSGRFSDVVLKLLESENLGKEPTIAIPNITLEAEAIQRIADREGIEMFQEGVMISKDAINNEIEEIKRERSRAKTVHNGGCADGQQCQQVVSEDLLETMLVQGWHVVLCLPSGKIVVSNEH